MTSISVAISGALLTPKNKRFQKDLEHRLNRWFQETANNIGDAFKEKYPDSNKMFKAEDDPEDDDTQTEILLGGRRVSSLEANTIRAMVLLGWRAINWETLVEMFRPYLKAAGDEGVDVGVGQVQMTDAKRAQTAAEGNAQEYADERSAQLGGMKRTADGGLVEDQDARWPLTDVMRRDLEASVAQAVEEGWTAEQLAAVVEASYALSPERATIIANTELTNAQSGGTYSLWRQSGVVTLVQWVTSDEHTLDDECDDYEAQGVVPLGHEFAEGLFSPRAHPFCRCSLEVVDPTDIASN